MDQLISVILPVYNGEKFVSESIKSILNQTYSNFELIIVNDCSTDSTLKIISDFALLDSRIKIITNETNKKLPASLNVGHNNAIGDYITWTSDDNLFKPNAFERYLYYLKNNECQIVFSDFDLINDQGIVLKSRKLFEPEYLINGNVVGASFMYKRVVFEILGGYNENLFLVEDYDFWLRAFIKFKYNYISENLYFYRSHGDSLSSQLQNNDEKNNLWQKNLTSMFETFLSNFTNKYVFFGSIFTKQMNHQPIPLADLLSNKMELQLLINNLTKNTLLNSKNIRNAFKDKLIQLLVSNPQKGFTIKFSYFIVKNFWPQLKKNDVKTLIKYAFFK